MCASLYAIDRLPAPRVLRVHIPRRRRAALAERHPAVSPRHATALDSGSGLRVAYFFGAAFAALAASASAFAFASASTLAFASASALAAAFFLSSSALTRASQHRQPSSSRSQGD